MQTKYDFNLLSVFLEVYNQRSITLAAERLNSTQPSVSNALKRLQKEIGTELFVREGRGISPTGAAVQLATQISPAYDAIENTLDTINGFNHQIEHVFRVMVNEPLMNLLQPLVEQDPDMGKCRIEFQVSPDTEEETFLLLSLQKVDLAIDIALLHSASYSSKFFYQDEAFVIARKNHPRIQGNIDLKTYYSEKHIVIRMKRIKSHVLSYLTQDSINNRVVSCESSSIFSLMGLVSKTDLIGVSSKLMMDEYQHTLQLQRFPLPFSYKPINYHMVWHNRNERQSAQVWLREKLENLLQVHKRKLL